MEARLSDNHEFNGMEQYSGFRLFGIGKATAGQIHRKERRAENKKYAGGGRRIAHAANVVALAWLRGAMLVIARFNVFGFSTRLIPAFLTKAELKQKHFDLANAALVKKHWDEHTAKTWYTMGGQPEKLQKAIMNGYNKPIFRHGKERLAKENAQKSNFYGELEEYSNFEPISSTAITTYIGIGSSAIGLMMKGMSKAGVKKDPYLAGKNPNGVANVGADTGDAIENDKSIEEIAAAGGNLTAAQKASLANVAAASEGMSMTKKIVIGTSIAAVVGLVIWYFNRKTSSN